MRFTFPSLALLAWLLAGFPASANTLYVDVNSPNPAPPYGDLSTAALTIQDAVDAAASGDVILVNDGNYANGFATDKTTGLPAYAETNRVMINKPLTVQSLNGPAAAYLSGSGMYRCAWLTNGTVLSGFTLISGAAGWTQPEFGKLTKTIISDGGGVTGTLGGGGVVTNCLLTGCIATGNGGGAYGVTLLNCTLTGNQATNGGGAAASTLINCQVTGNQVPATSKTIGLPGTTTGPGYGGGLIGSSAVNCLIAGNSAFVGGGAWDAPLLVNCTIVNNTASFYGGISPDTESSAVLDLVTNCLIYFNNAGTNANFGPGPYNNLSLSYTCTLPLPTGGTSNVTNEPTFVDFWGGDYHPDAYSPVINAGLNAVVTTTGDLDGNPRISGGTVDLGCFEFQNPASIISYAWLENYNLPVDGSADFLDSDGDGLNNWQEWIAGTNPTDATSVLTLYTPVPNQLPKGMNIRWQSVNNRTYYLQRSTNLFGTPGFTTIRSNLPGLAGTTSFIDATATNGNAFFYRVGVQ